MLTLNKAIEQVLRENHRPMTTSEIADIINSQHLYERGDKTPLKASQVSARVHQYPLLLRRENDKITLVNW